MFGYSLFFIMNFCYEKKCSVSSAAFTLSGFNDQERNLTFVKTDFYVLKF